MNDFFFLESSLIIFGNGVNMTELDRHKKQKSVERYTKKNTLTKEWVWR